MVAGFAGVLLLWGAPVATASAARPAVGAGPFWTAEERPVRLRLVSPAARQTGQGIFLIASVTLEQSCEYPGPLVALPSAPAESPEPARARIWRQLGVRCEPRRRVVEQPLHIATRAPGTFRFDGADGPVIEVKVSGEQRDRALDDKSSSRPCRFDEDCWVTDVCVPRKDDPTGIGICAQICGGNLDCAGQHCDAAPGIVGICKAPVAACDARHPCSWGKVCIHGRGVSWCQWPTDLKASTRGPCDADRDCGAGLKCFKGGGEAAPHGRCELLCSSAYMTCTGAHACLGDGICEWLGE